MAMLMSYLLFAAIVSAPFMRFRLFRKLTGFHDIRAGKRKLMSAEEKSVFTIYRAGRVEPEKLGDLRIFEATWGVKLLPPALLIWILILMIQMGEIRTVEDYVYLVLFLAASGYFCYTNYTMRIILDGPMLHKRDWRFRHQAYDLRQLESVEDNNGGYRLEFEDGRVTYFLRYLNGFPFLHDLLVAAVNHNDPRQFADPDRGLMTHNRKQKLLDAAQELF